MGIQSGTPGITPNRTVVGFAGQEWWVVGYNGPPGVYTTRGDTDSVTLLLKSAGTPYGTAAFRAGGDAGPGGGMKRYPADADQWYELDFTYPSDYSDSTLQRKMTAIAENADLFPARELALINERALTPSTAAAENDETGGAPVPGQKLWPLSQAEWTDIDNDEVRCFGSFFWMRSPYVDTNAIFGYPTGGQLFFRPVLSVFAVRPAFNLDISSVLFTSAAGGKDSAALGRLYAVDELSGPVKFTVETADTSFLSLICADTAERVVSTGGTVRIEYSGAKTAANKFVSCVIEKAGDGVLFYGRLAGTAGGTVSFAVPAGLPNGAYVIRLFNEECNGGMETDFACPPVSIPLLKK